MSLRHRPARSALSRHWLDYLDALQDALLAASSQDALALRLLPPHALELPDWSPIGLSTAFVPPPWAAPEAQPLFGMALPKTGKKFNDERLIRMGWAHQKTAWQR